MNKKLFFILILALFIRSFGLNLVLIDDEAENMMMASQYPSSEYTTSGLPSITGHPPLYQLLINIFLHFPLPIRLFHVFFGLLTIFLVYHFAKSIYTEKIAYISAGVMSLFFYHIFASLQVEKDGSLQTLLITLALYSYYRLTEKKGKKWVLITGFSFGLSLLTVYSGIIILPILVLFDLLHTKLRNLKAIVQISGIAFGVFALFPIITFVIDKPELFFFSLNWGGQNILTSTRVSTPIIISLIKHAFRLIQYGTPLLLFLPLLSLMNIKNKKEYFLISWVICVAFLYNILIPSGDIPRYQMLLIPPLSILAAKEIDKIDIKKSYLFGVSSLIFLGIILWLNSFTFITKPLTFGYFDKNIIYKNPVIWYSSTSGPLFSISSFSLFFVIFLSTILVVFYLSLGYFRRISKHSGVRKDLLVLFIALNIAFNMFLVGEFLFYIFSPNYNRVASEMIGYYEEIPNEGPLYVIHQSFPYYLNRLDFYPLLSEERKTLGKEGGAVIWLNIPPLFEGGPLEKIFNEVNSTCDLNKTFYEKGIEAGYIFRC